MVYCNVTKGERVSLKDLLDEISLQSYAAAMKNQQEDWNGVNECFDRIRELKAQIIREYEEKTKQC